MKFHYDRQNSDPPAPFLPVLISHPGKPDIVRDIIAKVDTGADLTAIPYRFIQELRLRVVGSLQVSGFEGQVRTVDSYAVRLELSTGPFAFLTVLGIDEPYALLGRDALNQFRLLLDGPALTLEVLP